MGGSTLSNSTPSLAVAAITEEPTTLIVVLSLSASGTWRGNSVGMVYRVKKMLTLVLLTAPRNKLAGNETDPREFGESSSVMDATKLIQLVIHKFCQVNSIKLQFIFVERKFKPV